MTTSLLNSAVRAALLPWGPVESFRPLAEDKPPVGGILPLFDATLLVALSAGLPWLRGADGLFVIVLLELLGGSFFVAIGAEELLPAAALGLLGGCFWAIAGVGGLPKALALSSFEAEGPVAFVVVGGRLESAAFFTTRLTTFFCGAKGDLAGVVAVVETAPGWVLSVAEAGCPGFTMPFCTWFASFTIGGADLLGSDSLATVALGPVLGTAVVGALGSAGFFTTLLTTLFTTFFVGSPVPDPSPPVVAVLPDVLGPVLPIAAVPDGAIPAVGAGLAGLTTLFTTLLVVGGGAVVDLLEPAFSVLVPGLGAGADTAEGAGAWSLMAF